MKGKFPERKLRILLRSIIVLRTQLILAVGVVTVMKHANKYYHA